MSLVVGVGIPTRDRIVAVPNAPGADDSMLVASLGTYGGGQVATALVAVSRLGQRAALVGCVGDDEDGQMVIAELAAEGVGTDAIRVVERARTASSVILVMPDGARTILYDPGAGVEPMLSDDSLALIGCAEGVVLAGAHSFSLEAALAPRPRGSLAMLDLDAFDDGEEPVVRACDIVIASAAYAVSRGLSARDATERLRDLGAPTAIVTCGADGAIGVNKDGHHFEPAYSGTTVDTTGAGDVYHGAFLVAALEGRTLPEAMRFAAVVAGLKCRSAGGRAGIPDRQEADTALERIGKPESRAQHTR